MGLVLACWGGQAGVRGAKESEVDILNAPATNSRVTVPRSCVTRRRSSCKGWQGVGCGVVAMFWLKSTFLALLFLDLDLDVLPSTGPQEQRRGSLMPWVLAA